MESFSQKSYRKKDRPNLPPVQIVNENEKFLSLSNGDTVLKTVFSLLYEDSNAYTTVTTNDEVDPKAFLSSTKLGGIVNQFSNNTGNQNTARPQDYIDDAPITRIDNSPDVPQAPITRIDNTQQHVQNNAQQPVQNNAQAPVTKIDNTPSPEEVEDQLFDDEVQLYGVVEATKRKRARFKAPNAAANPQVQQVAQPNGYVAQPTQQVSPAEMMFKSFKRNHEIVFRLEFKEKIGNPDFVKLMIENIDGDIVAYYKNIIMNSIMAQSDKVGIEVEYQIRKEIFGEEEANKFLPKVEGVKTKAPKKPKIKREVVKVQKEVIVNTEPTITESTLNEVDLKSEVSDVSEIQINDDKK